MGKTTIKQLLDYGQSIWLDSISRTMIDEKQLEEMIGLGLRGMTSNPTIFEKAVKESKSYDVFIQQCNLEGKSTFQIYDDLTVRDIQDAADIFRPIYEETDGLDGYVSLEVNPKLAYNTEDTITEARRLYRKVNRPNVMFKVPSAREGFPAIKQLLSEGININITLIFSLEQYINTAQAYLGGLEDFHQKGGDLKKVASVASMFVSRIDTLVDKQIDEATSQEKDEAKKREFQSLRGKAAVANSKMIYSKFQEIFQGETFQKLKARGAKVQRVLWGSTSTKDPVYSDIKYVTELIGHYTVNTLPISTFEAFLDHGVAKETLKGNIKESIEILQKLGNFGIDIDNVCAKLLKDGVLAFEKSFDSLLATIETKTQKLCQKAKAEFS